MNRDKGKAGRWSYHGQKEAANLLEALEALRFELGGLGEELIAIMREAGITPPEETASEKAGPSEG